MRHIHWINHPKLTPSEILAVPWFLMLMELPAIQHLHTWVRHFRAIPHLSFLLHPVNFWCTSFPHPKHQGFISAFTCHYSNSLLMEGTLLSISTIWTIHQRGDHCLPDRAASCLKTHLSALSYGQIDSNSLCYKFSELHISKYTFITFSTFNTLEQSEVTNPLATANPFLSLYRPRMSFPIPSIKLLLIIAFI